MQTNKAWKLLKNYWLYIFAFFFFGVTIYVSVNTLILGAALIEGKNLIQLTASQMFGFTVVLYAVIFLSIGALACYITIKGFEDAKRKAKQAFPDKEKNKQ